MNWLAQAVPAAWQPLAQMVFAEPAWQRLAAFLQQQQDMGQTVYPPKEQWFAALEAMVPSAVRVVIVGQDPYHGAGEAHG